MERSTKIVSQKTYDTEEVTAILDPNSGTVTMLIFTDGSYADSDKSEKLGQIKTCDELGRISEEFRCQSSNAIPRDPGFLHS